MLLLHFEHAHDRKGAVVVCLISPRDRGLVCSSTRPASWENTTEMFQQEVICALSSPCILIQSLLATGLNHSRHMHQSVEIQVSVLEFKNQITPITHHLLTPGEHNFNHQLTLC